MPLIEIHALPPFAEVDVDEVVRELNLAVSSALGCRLDAVWTVWHSIDGPFARGDSVSLVQHPETHGPIVHVYLKRSPSETELVSEMIARVLEQRLSLAPDNVFITVQPVALQSE